MGFCFHCHLHPASACHFPLPVSILGAELLNTGGINDKGVIYRVNKDGTGYSIIRSLTSSDVTSIKGSLLEGSDGVLYGTGNNGVFKINKDGAGYVKMRWWRAKGESR